jgi:hypothetical protein
LQSAKPSRKRSELIGTASNWRPRDRARRESSHVRSVSQGMQAKSSKRASLAHSLHSLSSKLPRFRKRLNLFWSTVRRRSLVRKLLMLTAMAGGLALAGTAETAEANWYSYGYSRPYYGSGYSYGYSQPYYGSSYNYGYSRPYYGGSYYGYSRPYYGGYNRGYYGGHGYYGGRGWGGRSGSGIYYSDRNFGIGIRF